MYLSSLQELIQEYTKKLEPEDYLFPSTFIGMISTLKSSQLIFVEYFAISPEYRSLGYGSKVISLLKEKYHDMNICLEIEIVQTDEGILEERL